MCLVIETCQRLSVSPAELFRRAIDQHHFTNGEEVLKNRFIRWFNYGEIPPYVEEFCRTAVRVKFERSDEEESGWLFV